MCGVIINTQDIKMCVWCDYNTRRILKCVCGVIINTHRILKCVWCD